MTLSVGIKFGPYEIVAPLGAGGMGEVYRARDTRLDRDVAIKVLPEAFARDKERILRFEREAKVLASLNHPNIAAIFGFEEFEGKRFLVMELAEGETLAERLDRGPIPIRDALELANGIAIALEMAHEKGIIHRDLKPANVKVTPDGSVKVLDFGLAKAMTGDATGTDIANSPTMTVEHTRPGVILGTAAYMSPEQARGKPIDKRTDIWSFGVLLYECLSGIRPFEGETVSDLIARILEREPDWAAVPPGTPSTIQLLLRRCLAKDRQRRLRDVGDARIELENAMADATSSTLRLAATAVDERRRSRASFGLRPLPWVFCLVLTAAFAIVFFRPRDRVRLDAGRVTRLSFPAPGVPARFGHLAISPDGRYVVHRSPAGTGGLRLHLRSMDDFDERVLVGTEGSFAPFVSPDGSEIGYFDDRALRVVSASGGASRKICEAFGYNTGTWESDGSIVFSTSRTGPDSLPGLSRVPASGGVPQVLTSIDPTKKERAHVMPQSLPDGKHALFAIETDTRRQVAVLALDTGKYRTILDDATQPRYAPTGHLVFYDFESLRLFAVPFDPVELRVTGPRALVLDDLLSEAAISQNGTLGYVPISGGEANVPVWVDREGNQTAIPVQPGAWVEPRLSLDGSRLILRQTQSPDCFLWLFDLQRSALTRLTFEGDSHRPVWDDDRQRVIVGMEKDAMRALYQVPVDGSSLPSLLWKGEGPEQPGRGPTGGEARVPFVEENAQNNRDIWILFMDPQPKAVPFLQSPFREDYPAFSPDGKWIAYTSNESGRQEVYVRAYPGPGGKIQLSTEGGTGPLWSRDGGELFYACGSAMMGVEVRFESVFTASAPRKLFEGQYLWDRELNYDVAADGKRFVMIKPPAGTANTQEVRMVLNWFEELKAKVPTR